MNLTGAIPPHLGNLSFLVYLDIHGNNFHGRLPEEFRRLRRLRFFNLCMNRFSGEVPLSFGHLSELRSMLLCNNTFTGVIPPIFSNLSKLETLNLCSNLLGGMIPAQIGGLPKLKNLILADNKLTGSIPFSIFNNTMLEFLSLSYNNLSGSLPVDMCRGDQITFPRLREIHLASNHIDGPLPPGLSWCSQLQVLSLSDNNFTGNIPKEFGNLQQLEEVYLDHNHLEGILPLEMGNLRKLRLFYLEKNQITGPIPREIGNLTTLLVLQFGLNNLTGDMPQEMGNLQDLVELNLPHNYLGGFIPFGVFNLSSVEQVSLEDNFFTGNLPFSMGHGLPNLKRFYLSSNNISGIIPASISNSSKLTWLFLDDNQFGGSVPNSLGDLSLLEELSLAKNKLASHPSSSELIFITSLTKCRLLRMMMIFENPFYGFIPGSIGNFSTSLEKIYAYSCYIKGSIPSEIGNLSSVIGIKLYENQFTGVIPETVKDLRSLQLFSLEINKLGGSLNMLCGLKTLAFLYLSQNQFSGSIPACLGNMTSLRHIFLGSNRLTSKIPKSLWSLEYLLELQLASNYLSGTLDQDIGNLKVIVSMDLSWNKISGNIPEIIGEMKNMAELDLTNNNLTGPIPDSFGGLVNLEFLDLSVNNLTGSIPKSLEALRYLKYFNVSFNHFRGEIPSEGPFRNFNGEFFISNDDLCGGPKAYDFPECRSAYKLRVRKLLQTLFSLLGIASVTTLVSALLYFKYRKKHASGSHSESVLHTKGGFFYSDLSKENNGYLLGLGSLVYSDLWEATNGYDEANLLGKGSFGSVYKATFPSGQVVALKVFDVQQEKAITSFDVESGILQCTRHRNLVKTFGYCSRLDFKALVLEYMANGNLEKWLHSVDCFLNLEQRLNVVVDVANALHYLHREYSIPVVHCDVKPSNILLDEEMVAHLSDVGISRFLDINESITYTKTLATFGYIAPEYGSYGQISTKCDVYSFGIVLMEVFTGKKPLDEAFHGVWNLKSWVAKSMPDKIFQVIDPKLLERNEHSEKLNWLCLLMELALNCVVESPRDRINISNVVEALKKIKKDFIRKKKFVHKDGDGFFFETEMHF